MPLFVTTPWADAGMPNPNTARTAARNNLKVFFTLPFPGHQPAESANTLFAKGRQSIDNGFGSGSSVVAAGYGRQEWRSQSAATASTLNPQLHDGCALISEPGDLVGCSGLGDDFEEAIIFARRLR